jgi:hypothetical protein
VERKGYFGSSVFEIERERSFGLKIRGIYDYFVLKKSEVSKSQFFRN